MQWRTPSGRGAPRPGIGRQLVTWFCVVVPRPHGEGGVRVGVCLGEEGLRFVGDGKMCGERKGNLEFDFKCFTACLTPAGVCRSRLSRENKPPWAQTW